MGKGCFRTNPAQVKSQFLPVFDDRSSFRAKGLLQDKSGISKIAILPLFLMIDLYFVRKCFPGQSLDWLKEKCCPETIDFRMKYRCVLHFFSHSDPLICRLRYHYNHYTYRHDFTDANHCSTMNPSLRRQRALRNMVHFIGDKNLF